MAVAALLVGAAFAQNVKAPYAEFKANLLSTNEAVRVQARRLLEANFAQYKDDALRELYGDTEDDGDYLASLISGVIAGIDAASDPPGSLSPGQPRKLSATLPYVA